LSSPTSWQQGSGASRPGYCEHRFLDLCHGVVADLIQVDMRKVGHLIGRHGGIVYYKLQPRIKRLQSMTTYSREDFEQIAAAIHKDVTDVYQHEKSFEAAALVCQR
jgi:hypothetical protein